jgi:hypothetical protein
MTITTRQHGQHQSVFHIRHRFADGLRAVEENVQLDRRRNLFAELRQQFFDVVHDFHRVRARLALHGQHDGARVVIPAATLLFCTLSDTLPNSCRRTGLPLR